MRVDESSKSHSCLTANSRAFLSAAPSMINFEHVQDFDDSWQELKFSLLFDHQLSTTLICSSLTDQLWTCSRYRWRLMRVDESSNSLSCFTTNSHPLSHLPLPQWSTLNMSKILMTVDDSWQELKLSLLFDHQLPSTLICSSLTDQLWTCPRFRWQLIRVDEGSNSHSCLTTNSHPLSSAAPSLINFEHVKDFDDSWWELTRAQILTVVWPPTPIHSHLQLPHWSALNMSKISMTADDSWRELKFSLLFDHQLPSILICSSLTDQLWTCPRFRWQLMRVDESSNSHSCLTTNSHLLLSAVPSLINFELSKISMTADESWRELKFSLLFDHLLPSILICSSLTDQLWTCSRYRWQLMRVDESS